MTSTPPHAPAGAELLGEIYDGRIRWDLLTPFPRQDPADRKDGDEAVAELRDTLAAWPDLDEVLARPLRRERLMRELAERDLLNMRPDTADGGRGMSSASAFRVLEAAGEWSPSLSLSMAVANTLGAGAYLSVIPDGPLRDFIASGVAGRIGAGADTEAGGASNALRQTVAVPVDDGRAYILNGEKSFITNAPVADIVDVSATVADDGPPRVALFWLTTDTPGVEVGPEHAYTGFAGAPNGVLRLKDVRVPAEHMLGDAVDGWRSIAGLTELAVESRMLLISAPALAIVKRCVRIAAEHVGRRSVNGVPLAGYSQVEGVLSDLGAEPYALDALMRWCTLGSTRADTVLEWRAGKNLTSMACWRASDAAVSLLGAQGVETAASKRRRGLEDAAPAEELQRAARVLRVSGGVDFLVDFTSGRNGLFARRYERAGEAVPAPAAVPDGVPERLRGHASFLTAEVARLAERARGLVAEYPDLAALSERQWIPIALNRVGAELLAMVLTVARASDPREEPGIDLADVYCLAARRRIADAWRELDDGGGAGRSRVTAALLARYGAA
ncbi:acyl-CoA dehydrogenase family protein [Phytomonospora endophytica]|uniref:Alkylation response protein AidB-like acyl-CoA dehydrogenase n=1 Tax=Phytomonospora endophytica TaxID=714109 RepID=A0A841FQ16_9ACTN|nr:acyl-CoA dehydrogenase [Phytomonospora endophytica]MBB6038186.1 alkylation response protein AidB-like acyl-CoA dehydrogenase [Phytomonospora endophytica]GIG67353.1 hypothetical protein Pen01_36480 [Phytomonospora endophytica]